MTTYGVTPRQAYNMFRAERKRVFPEWGIPPMAIAFTARYYRDWSIMAYDGSWHASIADTHFNPLTKTPYGISLNQHFMDYAHEDEVRGIILHEMAHIIAGWEADHGPVWAEVTEYIGSVASPHYLLREYKAMEGTPWQASPVWLQSLGYRPTFGP